MQENYVCEQCMVYRTELNKIKKTFQSILFLLFSFVNSFFPLFICCISSVVPYSGAQVTMGIGYAATFQLSFAQLGITFAISLFFMFNIRKNNNIEDPRENFVRSMFSTLVIGLISSFIYVVSSYLYLQFSNNRPNTLETITYGLDFVFSSVGFVLLSSFEAYLFLLICRRKVYITVFLFTIRTGLVLLLCYLLGIVAGLKALGIGLSLTISIFVISLCVFIYILKKYKIKITNKIKLFPKEKHLIKKISQESISGISLSLAKGIAILCLNLLMTQKLEDYVPLSYQMSRVIWFNIMYAIPWFGIGLSDAIKYNDVYNVDNFVPYSKKTMIKNYWFLIFVSMSVAACFAILGYFSVEPLAKLYIRNSHFSGVVPPMVGVPERIQELMNKFPPPTEFPPISSTDDWKSYIAKIVKDPEWSTWIKNIWGSEGGFFNFIYILGYKDQFVDWYIDYVSSTSYNADIIKALLLYKTPESINNITTPLLFAFKNSGFNAKAYIYICIYGLLCSGWSVMLPSTVAVDGKQFPPILLCIIYFLVISFIIIFGATFSITDVATKLGDSNPFRYLDAWTFPVAVVSVVVFSYVFMKWTIISSKELKYIKYQTQRKEFIKNINN